MPLSDAAESGCLSLASHSAVHPASNARPQLPDYAPGFGPRSVSSIPIETADTAQASAVKLAKPCALVTSATLRPSAVNGDWSERAELAFWTSAPTTSGSTRGTIPRRASVAGSEASLQMLGMDTADGLKFFSAATSSAAAAIT